MKTFSWSVAFFVTLLGCVPVSKINITQGIGGKVLQETGNQMPAPGEKRMPPKGISATVYIYPLTNVAQTIRKEQTPFFTTIANTPVLQVQSSGDGTFNAPLPAGEYSLFVKVNNMYYANRFDEFNNIAPVKVVAGQVSIKDIVISNTAVY